MINQRIMDNLRDQSKSHVVQNTKKLSFENKVALVAKDKDKIRDSQVSRTRNNSSH